MREARWRIPSGRGNIAGIGCPASEVRDTLQHLLTRTSEAIGHYQIFDSNAAFDLKFLEEIAAGGAGTSNRRH
jgi:hypothetical protein